MEKIKTGDLTPEQLQNEKQNEETSAQTKGTSGQSIFTAENFVTQKYNDIEHKVQIYLDNGGKFDNPRRFYINPAAILGLHIKQVITNWVAEGSLTFMYLPEGSPDTQKEKTGQPKLTITNGIKNAAKENANLLDSYTFRGDGYDILRILIMPKTKEQTSVSEESSTSIPLVNISEKDTQWMLSYAFSVYEVEDVNDVPELEGNLATYMKCLKLKFHDLRYHMLQTANIEYSTAMPKNAAVVPNTESDVAYGMGVLKTGEAILDIFNFVLANEINGGHPEFEIQDDAESWDKGSAEIFYTSPACDSAYDDIEYIYNHHLSETVLKGETQINPYDMALLHTGRASSFGFLEPIKLTPLSKFFQKAGKELGAPGELQREHFFITATTQELALDKVYRAPMGSQTSKNDLKTKFGEIISYSFVDMSPSVNSNVFCNKPVYSVNIKEREFNVEFRGNTVQEARSIISESYIQELFKYGTDNKKLFLPTLHESKKSLNQFPTFTLNGTSVILRQKNGLHDLLYTGIFQNACICFQVYGLTLREPGTFIGIDKTEGEKDNDYNNKLYGQWFVVKVDHLFQAGAYLNIIYAVKIHRYKELLSTFEKTY